MRAAGRGITRQPAHCAVVTAEPDPAGRTRDRIAAEHGYDDGLAFDPPGTTRADLHLAPTRIIEH